MLMASDQHLRKVGRFWDERTTTPLPNRVRWWQSPRIIAHVNGIVCGEKLPGINQGAIRLVQSMFPGRTFHRGISIGCGQAAKELGLVRQGLVDHFDLFELSAERARLAMNNFAEAGLSDRVSISSEDFFKLNVKDRYDFVHWDNSLHHMFDCDEAVAKTYALLESGGCFFMNDYVGKSRFQWSDRELSYINAFRNSLPDECYLTSDGQMMGKEVARPSLKSMVATDPSEAADSESILPSLRRRLRNPRIVTTGGTIYHTGLNDILANIAEASPVLGQALKMDSILNDSGVFQYAVCVHAAR